MTLTTASETGPGWWTEGEMRLRSQPGGMPQNLVAASLSHGSNPNSNAAGRRREDDVNLVAETVRSHPRPGSNSLGNMTVTHALSSVGADASEDGTGRGTPLYVANAISARDGKGAGNVGRDGKVQGLEFCGAGVRRLTPTECERLQGLPDGWTLPGADSRRYAGLGDAVTASVAEWIGKRILARSAS